MRKELEQRLVERWPKWFNTKGDVRYTAMPWGFCVGDGWFDTLWRLCEDLKPLVAEFEVAGGPKFEVLQVKEKSGGLRVYVNCDRNEAIQQRIGIAIQESLHTCEICGQPGKQHSGDWSKTLCDEHDASEQAREIG
ncbi:MAG: hypothetical protein WCA20_22285 [Candidatus Sulfotelmatobacter sp.]